MNTNQNVWYIAATWQPHEMLEVKKDELFQVVPKELHACRQNLRERRQCRDHLVLQPRFIHCSKDLDCIRDLPQIGPVIQRPNTVGQLQWHITHQKELSRMRGVAWKYICPTVQPVSPQHWPELRSIIFYDHLIKHSKSYTECLTLSKFLKIIQAKQTKSGNQLVKAPRVLREMETNTVTTSRLRFTSATAFPLRLLLQLPAAIEASSTDRKADVGPSRPAERFMEASFPYTSSMILDSSWFFYICSCFMLLWSLTDQNKIRLQQPWEPSSEIIRVQEVWVRSCQVCLSISKSQSRVHRRS